MCYIWIFWRNNSDIKWSRFRLQCSFAHCSSPELLDTFCLLVFVYVTKLRAAAVSRAIVMGGRQSDPANGFKGSSGCVGHGSGWKLQSLFNYRPLSAIAADWWCKSRVSCCCVTKTRLWQTCHGRLESRTEKCPTWKIQGRINSLNSSPVPRGFCQ